MPRTPTRFSLEFEQNSYAMRLEIGSKRGIEQYSFIKSIGFGKGEEGIK